MIDNSSHAGAADAGTEKSRVIIIGSGPAGVSAAWPLVEAGAQVLMIDASEAPQPSSLPTGSISELRHASTRWKTQFGPDFAGLHTAGDYSPKLSTPFARSVLHRYGESISLTTDNFLALGSLGKGGLSNIWGAIAAVYDDKDLGAFPISSADFAASYRHVMNRIGVSGPSEHEGANIDAGPDLTEAARRVFTKYSRGEPSSRFRLQRATNAVLMQSRDDRGGCAQCGLCLWGCHRKSIYSASFEIGKLRSYPNFTYRSGLLVTEISEGDQGNIVVTHAAGVRDTLSAPVVILAAGAISTTSLALRRRGLFGRRLRLLTNPVAAAAFLVPSLVGSRMPERSFSLAQLSYELMLDEGGSASGALYGADTLPLSEVANRLPLSRPVALHFSRAIAPALLIATIYLPGKYSANSIQLTGDREGAELRIEGDLPEATRKTLAVTAKRLGRAMKRLGAFPLPKSFVISQPGADAHYAGTVPMGGTGELGCSISGEVNGCSGLYVVDGAALPDLPAKHCTLTIMANADRISRHLVETQRFRAH